MKLAIEFVNNSGDHGFMGDVQDMFNGRDGMPLLKNEGKGYVIEGDDAVYHNIESLRALIEGSLNRAFEDTVAPNYPETMDIAA